MTLNSLLFTAGPVVKFEDRFFITFGHCGFNCRANNRDGFATEAAALKAIRRYTSR